MTIKTNHHFRPILQSYELTEKELVEFDYLEGESLEAASFFRYHGTVYELGQFEGITRKGQRNMGFNRHDLTGELKEWDAIQTDSFFSGVVVKIAKDCESVKVGLVFS